MIISIVVNTLTIYSLIMYSVDVDNVRVLVTRCITVEVCWMPRNLSMRVCVLILSRPSIHYMRWLSVSGYVMKAYSSFFCYLECDLEPIEFLALPICCCVVPRY